MIIPRDLKEKKKGIKYAEGASGERIALLEREVGELKIERLVELYNQYNSDVELFKNSNIHGNREECIYDSGVGEVLTLLEREIERFRENYNMRVSLFGINGVGFGSTKSQTSITYIQERSSHRPTRLAVKF